MVCSYFIFGEGGGVTNVLALLLHYMVYNCQLPRMLLVYFVQVWIFLRTMLALHQIANALKLRKGSYWLCVV